MLHEVISTLSVGENTAITILGSGAGLKNGIVVTGSSGKKYKIISVGMTAGENPEAIGKSTDLLIEGIFKEPAIQT